jgi:hypothetical protein
MVPDYHGSSRLSELNNDILHHYKYLVVKFYLTYLECAVGNNDVTNEKVNVYLPSLMIKVPDHVYVFGSLLLQ